MIIIIECWLINMGDIKLYTDKSVLDKSIPNENKLYDIYKVSLLRLYMKYYPSI
jgi:hypothetical protein